MDGAIRKLSDGTKVFVGQRDDPFFVDLGATFDGLNVRKLTGNEGQGKDDLSGMNTHSVVMQIPEGKVTKNGKSVSGPREQRGGGRVVHHGAPDACEVTIATRERPSARREPSLAARTAGCRSRGSATRW